MDRFNPPAKPVTSLSPYDVQCVIAPALDSISHFRRTEISGLWESTVIYVTKGQRDQGHDGLEIPSQMDSEWGGCLIAHHFLLYG